MGKTKKGGKKKMNNKEKERDRKEDEAHPNEISGYATAWARESVELVCA